jgi:anti-anti-sigma factor
MPLNLRDQVRGARHTLTLAGELDIATAPELRDEIARRCQDGAAEIVLDLHELSFIDSTGLRLLLSSKQMCEERGCDFSLIHVHHPARHTLELSGVAGWLLQRRGALGRRFKRRSAASRKASIDRFEPDLAFPLDLNLDAARSARNYLRDLLRNDRARDIREPALLLMGELVTPIAAHGNDTFLERGELRMWLRPELLRVELAVPRELLFPASEQGEARYEHTLLDELANRWSLETSDLSACIWFELDRHPEQ